MLLTRGFDAQGALAKAGVRPSDKLLDLRRAPALRRGQHLTVEVLRDTETKIMVVVSWGPLHGGPEFLREEECVRFLKAHKLTRKSLVKWWTERHPEAGEREAEAALRAMNPRELQNATLLMDNEAARPVGNRHQVNYDPFA